MNRCGIKDMDMRIKRIAIKSATILTGKSTTMARAIIANQVTKISTDTAREYMNNQHGGHAHFDIVSTWSTKQM